MKRLVIILSLLFVFCMIALMVIPKSLPAVDENTLPTEIVVVRAYFDNRDMVNNLAAHNEPWEVNHKEGYLVIEVTPAEYNELLEAGFRVKIDEKLTRLYNTPLKMAPNQANGIPGYSCYRTVEETFALAADIVTDYPQLAAWVDIGDSWNKANPGGAAGYDLMVLKLTNSTVAGPKPKLFVMSSIHAREYAPAELNNRFAAYLVENYGLNADVTWLLDYHEIHLLLQANPDGRKQAETGLFWRKNTNQNYCGPTSNDRGADLNRNFEFGWGCCNGSSGTECSETYRGSSPASEPETQVIQTYVRSIFPDQRGSSLTDPAPDDAMGIFLDLHSYSELVLWPWGFTADPPPNSTSLTTLGRKLAYFNGYEADQAISLYATDGTTDDFAYGELGLAAYTFELGTAFFQDCASFENQILPDNLDALIYAAKTTAAPYMLPAGPDALDLSFSEYGVSAGTAVTLTTTLDDTRYNNIIGIEPTQAIQAGEMYVNVPAWENGAVAVPLTAVDGTFDSSVETAQGTLDTSGLSEGKHIIFVRGQDAAGNWGPVTAEFLYVLEEADYYLYLPVVAKD
jgi:carboxypeptidase T